MSNGRTIKRKAKKTVRRRKKPASGEQHRQSASTMHIPVEAVFTGRPNTTSAGVDILCPGKDPVYVPLNQKTFVIGRHSSCDVSLPIANVSREHAELRFNGEEYVVEDLDSTNGTFVNNVKIGRCILRDNDMICIGEAKIRFSRQQAK